MHLSPKPFYFTSLALMLGVFVTPASPGAIIASPPPPPAGTLSLPHLRRRRRFALPTFSGATLETAFTLTLPVEDAVWPICIDIPYTYDFDSQS